MRPKPIVAVSMSGKVLTSTPASCQHAGVRALGVAHGEEEDVRGDERDRPRREPAVRREEPVLAEDPLDDGDPRDEEHHHEREVRPGEARHAPEEHGNAASGVQLGPGLGGDTQRQRRPEPDAERGDRGEQHARSWGGRGRRRGSPSGRRRARRPPSRPGRYGRHGVSSRTLTTVRAVLSRNGQSDVKIRYECARRRSRAGDCCASCAGYWRGAGAPGRGRRRRSPSRSPRDSRARGSRSHGSAPRPTRSPRRLPTWCSWTSGSPTVTASTSSAASGSGRRCRSSS